MKSIIFTITIMVAALIFSCNNNVRENHKMKPYQNFNDRTQDEKDIRTLEAEYDAAWQVGNTEALVTLLTEDAVVVNPRGEIARGRTEFKEMLDHFLNGPAKGSTHKSQILRVEFITEDVAIVDGQAVIGDTEVTDNSTASLFNHRFSDIVVKRNNRWSISQIRAYTIFSDK